VSYDALILKAAHRHCATHRAEVLASRECGCFHCETVFAPAIIEDWLEETGGDFAKTPDPWTALCPKCGIDAVIGDASPHPATDLGFLRAMHVEWFGDDNAQD
jgi:hypothetical protein